MTHEGLTILPVFIGMNVPKLYMSTGLANEFYAIVASEMGSVGDHNFHWATRGSFSVHVCIFSCRLQLRFPVGGGSLFIRRGILDSLASPFQSCQMTRS